MPGIEDRALCPKEAIAQLVLNKRHAVIVTELSKDAPHVRLKHDFFIHMYAKTCLQTVFVWPIREDGHARKKHDSEAVRRLSFCLFPFSCCTSSVIYGPKALLSPCVLNRVKSLNPWVV